MNRTTPTGTAGLSADTDTLMNGVDAPFEPWEGDFTALVHVLWHLRREAVMVDRPGRRAPLRDAMFLRLFAGGQDDAALIGDLRAILDEHDPDVTPGAVGARYLTHEELTAVPTGPGESGDPADSTAADVLLRSRWRHAMVAHARAQELTDAARAEEALGNTETANRLRERAQAITGVPAASSQDRPVPDVDSGEVDGL